MKRQWKKVTALGLAMACVLPMAASAETTIHTELNGTEYDIEYTKVPERCFVTLANFTTEMLLELGLSDKIVGYGYMDNEVPEEDLRRSFPNCNGISD